MTVAATLNPAERPPLLARGLLIGSLFVFAAFAAPAIYGLVAFHGVWWRMEKPNVSRFILFNSAANLIVGLGSWNLTGRLDERLSNVLRRAALVHGGLAFFTLISRHYYSIPMLLTGAPLSVLAGSAVMIVRHRADAPTVGILGPWHWITEDRALRCRRIDSPAEALAPFDLILITFEGPLPAKWTPMLSRALLAGKEVRHIAEYLEEARGVASVDHFDLDHLPSTGLASYRTPKRIFDVLCVLLTAPLTASAALVAMLGVWLTMGRPVLFTQTRVGLGGTPFRMFKLRTMRPPRPGEPVVATARNDARITPLGRLYRRFRIDELPQLWNVLAGDMSLIGPRPEQPLLAEQYIREVPAFAFRVLVRPGITGWAQVRAAYAADLAETRVKLAYDLFYLKNFGLGLDLQILARTTWTLISGGGVR